jgi:GntR family transcriptional regulator
MSDIRFPYSADRTGRPMISLQRRPLPDQLRDQIWETVKQGHYRPGDRLPSEQELAAKFSVSRATVREALKTMEDEHLIICRHGLGRFVAPAAAGVYSDAIANLKSVTELAQDLAIPLSTRVLSVREELPDEFVKSRLNLQSGATVVILERLRLAHDEPVIYSVDHFSRAIVAGTLDARLFEGSLLTVMEGSWNIRLSYSRAIISAVNLSSELSQQVGVPDCVPWILMEQVNYDAQDHPVLYSRDYHRGDKFQFHALRRRRR